MYAVSAFDGEPNKNESSRPANTLQKSQLFSRKLKRRLTQRTLTEARAIQKQSKEAINVLLYAAEMIVNDPKLAVQKLIELWINLSKDEPENQERPQTLEQLVGLITRESARTLVHLVNYVTFTILQIPRSIVSSSTEIAQHYMHGLHAAIKWSTNKASLFVLLKCHYKSLDNYSSDLLVQVAIWLAGRETHENNHAIESDSPTRRIRRDLGQQKRSYPEQ